MHARSDFERTGSDGPGTLIPSLAPNRAEQVGRRHALEHVDGGERSRSEFSAMISDWLILPTLLAALGSGLIGGVFFAFSTFVMRALARLPAEQAIAAMQSINVEVIKSLFMAAFLGTAALGAVLGIASLFRWGEPGSDALLAGGVLYLAGTVLVTLRFNVPLNTALASEQAGTDSGAQTWTRYLGSWTLWNHLRTLAAVLACAAYAAALAEL
jgi:uncharacterized membrane protein